METIHVQEKKSWFRRLLDKLGITQYIQRKKETNRLRDEAKNMALQDPLLKQAMVDKYRQDEIDRISGKKKEELKKKIMNVGKNIGKEFENAGKNVNTNKVVDGFSLGEHKYYPENIMSPPPQQPVYEQRQPVRRTSRKIVKRGRPKRKTQTRQPFPQQQTFDPMAKLNDMAAMPKGLKEFEEKGPSSSDRIKRMI